MPNLSCSYLYIVAQASADAPVKIGVSDFPENRLRQLQTGNPLQLRLVATFEGDGRDQVLGWEELVHKLFSDKRLSGEWFDVSAQTIIEHVKHWKINPGRSKPFVRPRKSSKSSQFVPFHPEVPDHLQRTALRDMTVDERIQFWSCFDLPSPPFGFHDWYIVGTEKDGVLAAFPVVGFVHGEISP